MKNTFIILIIALLPNFLYAQNFCETGGAQGGSLGVSDCYPYNSPCPEESNAEILLILDTDMFASETSWQVQDLTDTIMVAEESIFENDSTYNFLLCAQKDHCYHFAIADSAGNGIDANSGGYSLYWNGDLIITGSDFGAIDSISFGACCNNFSAKLMGGIPCIDYSEGQVEVVTSGGTSPYDYLWSNGTTFTEIQSVSPEDGLISVTVTDASNCIAVDTFQTADLMPLNFTVESGYINPCDSTSNGYASVSIISGIPPFNYSWSSGGTGQTEQNLAQGTHIVTVTDAGSCTMTDTVVISRPSVIEAQSSIVDVSCHGDSTASIDLTVSEGNGPYNYLWSTGAITEDIDDLPAGTYSVTVTDTNNCSYESFYTITEPDSIIIIVDSVQSETLNNKDGDIQITVSGGTGSCTYKWYLDYNLISEQEDPSGLSAGKYILIVTDSNGCNATITVDLKSTGVDYVKLSNSISIIPNPTIGKFVMDINLDNYYQVQITVTNNIGDIIITTQPQIIQEDLVEFDLSNYSPGLYIVKVNIDGQVITRQLILSK